MGRDVVEHGAVDGMPVDGEHVALDLVNSTFIRGGLRGHLVDVLVEPADLAAWVERHADGLDPASAPAGELGPAELAAFRELRRALRAVLTAVVAGEPAAEPDVAVVNEALRAAPGWAELPPGAVGRAVPRSLAGERGRVLLARVAQAAVELLTGDRRGSVKACPAPGCILFFLQQHARRAWCSTSCGTRVRVARHSRRRAEE
ncbi:ABATE domain-containing protein [Streptomyces sp. BE20]|uniref:CGNR zinc finger domain-containing protein n=1 Tax=Streptomyces sp. BE20 TaxID=3002525 RepID=UPI002E79D271|nr:ABATE domain-containing protein [Streptomyces sp. BE20]MEE1827467.1 ABATE domain-containing protein [Streptomyces sp. BE20]